MRNLAPLPLPLSPCAYGDKLCVGEFLRCCLDFYVTPTIFILINPKEITPFIPEVLLLNYHIVEMTDGYKFPENIN